MNVDETRTAPLRIAAVIVAAGRGERAGAHEDGPKQYRRIGDRPVIAHTLATFCASSLIDRVVIVIHPDDRQLLEAAIVGLTRAHLEIVSGGPSRQASVLAGLEALAGSDCSHVLIHDGVRPFADGPLIAKVISALADGASCAIPALPVTDTLKSVRMPVAAQASGAGPHVMRTVPRDGLFAVQTPQGFVYDAILGAHRKAAASLAAGFTDDASIAEWAGFPVQLVEGAVDNIKLTLKEEIAMAHDKLTRDLQPLPDVRTGNGYDVHALVHGDGVTLCGVFIAHHKALLGHSDADVGYHALTDALLATCGAGDIGDHFPPSDPQWKGVASKLFLAHAADIVRSYGGTIMNADVSLICEAPRVGPHREAMRAAMSRDLDIALERCSVKATTNEKIGFIGREEGIAAIATATVVFGGSAR
jgi:2-C-methyl-D-erythritol 4-phosphate cytidylyltransferase / 2-C-methyl-D-erythritol 2,4-cyclodiphosphate synthase